MAESRMTALSLRCIEKDIVECLQFDDVIDECETEGKNANSVVTGYIHYRNDSDLLCTR